MSIDLGFAYAPRGRRRGRSASSTCPATSGFVRNMLAGASGIDFALLVVAADDGVMPQTREHLAILELLGVTRGAVALSKSDRADARAPATRCSAEIAVLLAATPLGPRRCFRSTPPPDDRVSPRCARTCSRPPRNCRRDRTTELFRLAGGPCLHADGSRCRRDGNRVLGQVRAGDTVAVMPAGTQARVRGIHAQNQAAASGHAGQRCAINLAGIDKERHRARRLARGSAPVCARRRASTPACGCSPTATCNRCPGRRCTCTWAPASRRPRRAARADRLRPAKRPACSSSSNRRCARARRPLHRARCTRLRTPSAAASCSTRSRRRASDAPRSACVISARWNG